MRHFGLLAVTAVLAALAWLWLPVAAPGLLALRAGDPAPLPESVSKVNFPGCNNGMIAQLPAPYDDVFLGREMFNGPGCEDRDPKVVQYSFDWKTRQFTQTRVLVRQGSPIADGFMVVAAYDPDVVFFKDEYWVAFECKLEQTKVVSACVGPWSDTGGLDLARTTAVVNGNSGGSNAEFYSGSVPKLLVFDKRLYLFWSAVRMGSDRVWKDVTTRGMEVELRQVRGGKPRVYGKGLDTAVAAMDPLRNVEVLGVDMDPSADSVADMFALYAQGGVIYATAGVGGGDCLLKPAGINMKGDVPGCYRLAIFASLDPLLHDGFNLNRIDGGDLYGNGQGYTRLILSPEGERYFLSTNFPTERAMPGQPRLPAGQFMYPAPVWESLFPVVRGAEIPRSCDLDRLRAGGEPLGSYRLALAYCLVLGRLPEPAAWEARDQTAKPSAAFALRLARSKEFAQRFHPDDGDDAGYVRIVNRLLLSGDVEAWESNRLVQELQAGTMTRDQVFDAVLRSPESQRLNGLLFRQ